MSMSKMTNISLKLSLGVLAYLCYRESYELFQKNTLQHALFTHYGLETLYWLIKITSVALGVLVLRFIWKKDPRGIKYSIVFLAIAIFAASIEWSLLNMNPEFALESYIKSREARGFPIGRERASKALELMSSHFSIIFSAIYGIPLFGLYLKKREIDSEHLSYSQKAQ
jgi:hypothetical protein